MSWSRPFREHTHQVDGYVAWKRRDGSIKKMSWVVGWEWYSAQDVLDMRTSLRSWYLMGNSFGLDWKIPLPLSFLQKSLLFSHFFFLLVCTSLFYSSVDSEEDLVRAFSLVMIVETFVHVKHFLGTSWYMLLLLLLSRFSRVRLCATP